jgi:cytosine permease
MDFEYENSAVPKKHRRGFWAMFMVMTGFTFFSGSMIAGGVLGTGLSAPDFLLAVLCGNLILAFYTGTLAIIASRTGFSTHLLARYSFGMKGAWLVSAVLAATQIGWFGVGIAMFARPLQLYFGCSPWPLTLGIGMMITMTAYFGFRAMVVLSCIAVPSILLLGGMSIFDAFAENGGFQLIWNVQPTHVMALAPAVAVCIGSFISGGTLIPDFARFSRRPWKGFLATALAFFAGNSLMFIFGAVGAKVFKQSDIAIVLQMQGLIMPAILLLGLNIWTTNDNALYASGLGFSSITGLPKRYIVLLNGLVGTLMADVLFAHFRGWLIFLNTVLPPLGAIIIVDYFIMSRGRYLGLHRHEFRIFRLGAFIAWGAGALTSNIQWGIAPVNGIVTAGAVYFILELLSMLIQRYWRNSEE